MSRYVYLGDRLTDPALVGQPCDPVFRTTGKSGICVVGRKPRNQLVRFADGTEVVVLARRLPEYLKLREAGAAELPGMEDL